MRTKGSAITLPSFSESAATGRSEHDAQQHGLGGALGLFELGEARERGTVGARGEPQRQPGPGERRGRVLRGARRRGAGDALGRLAVRILVSCLGERDVQLGVHAVLLRRHGR